MATPLALFEREVGTDWIDDNRHMGALHYAIAFGEGMRVFADRLDFDRRGGTGIFLLDWHIAYLQEVTEGETAAFDVRVLDASDKLVHYLLEMRGGRERFLAATSECVEIHIDLETRRPTPFSPEVQSRLDELLTAHRSLAPAETAGRKLGIRRKN